MDVQSKRVSLGIDFVRLSRVVELLEHLARTDAPAFILDTDVGGRVVVGLKEVGRIEVGGEVGCDELFVLAAGLVGEGSVSVVLRRRRRRRRRRRGW